MKTSYDKIIGMLEKDSGANNHRQEEDLIKALFQAMNGYSIGWADYNDSGVSDNLVADTWTAVHNDAAGAQTREDYLPDGVTRLLNPVTGKFDLTDMTVGSFLFWRFDMMVTTSQNNEQVQLRNSWAQGGSFPFTNGTIPPVEIKNQGTITLTGVSGGYIGSSDVVDNPMGLEIKTSGPSSVLVNTGVWLLAGIKW